MNDELCRSETLVESHSEIQLPTAGQSARLPWNCPVLTLISLKRTMNGSGGFGDGSFSTTVPQGT